MTPVNELTSATGFSHGSPLCGFSTRGRGDEKLRLDRVSALFEEAVRYSSFLIPTGMI
jgi:hypothetical protein